jgi:hypothetical protein
MAVSTNVDPMDGMLSRNSSTQRRQELKSHELSNEINFTSRQMAWLESNYPEVIGTPNTTTEELRFRGGQRSVLAAIRAKVIR